jgi:predicted RNA methylase
MTPDALASRIVKHHAPVGTVLEPCAGTGAFLRALAARGNLTQYCEISEGIDFYKCETKVDWVITNPPWSKINSFLYRSMMLSKDVVFLMTVNHAFTKARMKDVKELGFQLAGIQLVDWPTEWPKSGFELGVIHWHKGPATGSIAYGRL